MAHRGYPITNDPIYSRENWAKKSTDEFSKELTDVLFRNDNISALITKKVDNVSDVDDKIKQTISYVKFPVDSMNATYNSSFAI